jgi:hypothetical protein
VGHELRVRCDRGLVVRQSPAGQVVNMEAEECTLLGTITEQRLFKTMTEEDLASAIVRSLMRYLTRAL